MRFYLPVLLFLLGICGAKNESCERHWYENRPRLQSFKLPMDILRRFGIQCVLSESSNKKSPEKIVDRILNVENSITDCFTTLADSYFYDITIGQADKLMNKGPTEYSAIALELTCPLLNKLTECLKPLEEDVFSTCKGKEGLTLLGLMKEVCKPGVYAIHDFAIGAAACANEDALKNDVFVKCSKDSGIENHQQFVRNFCRDSGLILNCAQQFFGQCSNKEPAKILKNFFYAFRNGQSKEVFNCFSESSSQSFNTRGRW